jgi:hypothetical protein
LATRFKFVRIRNARGSIGLAFVTIGAGCNGNKKNVDFRYVKKKLRGFWWYGISVSGPFGQPGQYIKKSWRPIEQLLSAVFSCLQVQNLNCYFFILTPKT